MSIAVSCACGKIIQAGTEHIGKRIRCPACRAILEVRAPVVATPAEGGALQRKQVISCPGCKKEWPKDTVICVECGYNIKTGEQLKTKSTRHSRRSGVDKPAPTRRAAEQSMDRGVELSKENGDELWQFTNGKQDENGDWRVFHIHVLTRRTVLSRTFNKEAAADDAWEQVRDAESRKEYQEALGKGAVAVDLSSITRVELGEATMDDFAVFVSYEDDAGKARRLEMIVPRQQRLFKQLHQRLDPDARIRSGQTGLIQRMIKPLVFMVAVFFVGAAFTSCAVLVRLAGEPQPQPGQTVQIRYRTIEGIRAVGPVWTAVAFVLVLLAMTVWMVVRLLHRPRTRFFEPREREEATMEAISQERQEGG
jgi:hypothetical protein